MPKKIAIITFLGVIMVTTGTIYYIERLNPVRITITAREVVIEKIMGVMLVGYAITIKPINDLESTMAKESSIIYNINPYYGFYVPKRSRWSISLEEVYKDRLMGVKKATVTVTVQAKPYFWGLSGKIRTYETSREVQF
jgi:hypothetical protein